MKKLSFILILSLLFTACVSDKPKVTVKNDNSTDYDSICVFANDKKTTFKNVSSGDSVTGKIHFSKKHTSDGTYTIQLFKDGKISKSRTFGYYSNGNSQNSSFNITIRKDSILVEY